MNERLWVRRFLILVWCAANVVLLVAISITSWRSAVEIIARVFDHAKTWDVSRWAGLLAPPVTWGFSYWTHLLDQARHGGGIRSRFARIGARQRFNVQESYVSAMMAKQRVLAAIALAMLVVVNRADTTSDTYRQVIVSVATVGFIASILVILTSLLCADYSHRFKWEEQMTEALLRKSLTLEVWSWHLLAMSLIWSVALIREWLSVVVNFGYGSLLWYYYFTSPVPAAADGVRPTGR